MGVEHVTTEASGAFSSPDTIFIAAERNKNMVFGGDDHQQSLAVTSTRTCYRCDWR